MHLAVVFSGPACEACNASLKQLQSNASQMNRTGAKIIAISNTPLNSPMVLEGLKIVDVTKVGSQINALVGSGSIPSHATYLIDRKGRVRYEYTGNHPISGFEESFRRLKELSLE